MKFSCDNIVVVCRMPFLRRKAHCWDMMTSSNGNIFHVTDPFVRGIHMSPVNSPHKCQWRGALMFLWSATCINGWVNNREAGDLRRPRAHYDIIMVWCSYDEIRKMITKMLSLQWNDNQHSMYIIGIWYLLGIITRQVFLIHALAWIGVLVIHSTEKLHLHCSAHAIFPRHSNELSRRQYMFHCIRIYSRLQ